jgi:hypothetical protein
MCPILALFIIDSLALSSGQGDSVKNREQADCAVAIALEMLASVSGEASNDLRILSRDWRQASGPYKLVPRQPAPEPFSDSAR